MAKYPQMGLEQNRDENKSQETVQNQKQRTQRYINTTKRRTHITVPYIKGLGESVKNIAKDKVFKYFSKEANHQGPPDGTQGQRSNHSEKWHHL